MPLERSTFVVVELLLIGMAIVHNIWGSVGLAGVFYSLALLIQNAQFWMMSDERMEKFRKSLESF